MPDVPDRSKSYLLPQKHTARYGLKELRRVADPRQLRRAPPPTQSEQGHGVLPKQRTKEQNNTDEEQHVSQFVVSNLSLFFLSPL